MLKRFLSVLTASFLLSQAASAQNEVSTSETETSESGYFNTTELIFAEGFGERYNDRTYGFHNINGFRINKHFSVGVGVGVEKYEAEANFWYGSRGTAILAPLFTDVRWFFGKGKVQPYLAQAVGYAFCIKQNQDYDWYGSYKEVGGLIVNPAIGLSANVSSKIKLNISAGYRYQENMRKISAPNYYFRDYGYLMDGSNKMKKQANLISFKAGLTF